MSRTASQLRTQEPRLWREWEATSSRIMRDKAALYVQFRASGPVVLTNARSPSDAGDARDLGGGGRGLDLMSHVLRSQRSTPTSVCVRKVTA